MDIHVRAATVGDQETVAEFNRLLALETEDKTLDHELLAGGVKLALGDPGRCLYFVAESGGSVVGQCMLTFEWSDWRKGYFWWFQSVYVHRDFRKQGVFRALFDHVLTLAKNAPDLMAVIIELGWPVDPRSGRILSPRSPNTRATVS